MTAVNNITPEEAGTCNLRSNLILESEDQRQIMCCFFPL